MRIITSYKGKKRNETRANTTYTVEVQFVVTDLDMEDGVKFEQWVIDNFPYIPFEVMLDATGKKLPECDCNC